MAANGVLEVKQGKASLSKKEETPEEEQLQQALKHLDLLHVRCRDVRNTLPRMLSSMPEVSPSTQSSIEALFGDLISHMKGAGAEIQDFATLYNSEESKKVLEQARKSREVNPKGIKTWRYKDHPDWWEVPQ